MSKNFTKDFYSKNDFVLLRTELDKLNLVKFDVTTSFKRDNEKHSVNTIIITSGYNNLENEYVKTLDIFQCDNQVCDWIVNVYPKLSGDDFSIFQENHIDVYFDMPF